MATLSIEQAQQAGVIVGLRQADPANPVRPRLDIDRFLVDDPDCFNLFVLALSQLQNDPNIMDKMDWYQLSGIHGLPTTPWDGVRRPSGRVGYCIHGLLQFPTWHRPYVAGLEQSIYSEMVTVANSFTGADQQKYQQAASRFRMPYWDWFRPRGNEVTFPGVVDQPDDNGSGGTTSFPYDFKLPQIISVPEIMVITPDNPGTPQLLSNPLYTFDFPQSGGLTQQEWSIAQQDAPYNTVKTTRRPRAPKFDQSNDAGVDTVLNDMRESHVTNLYNLLNFSGYKDWRAFSNHSTVAQLARGSLEGIHDDYHVFVGGFGGHMSTPPLAAFDPVFWLHHCNVDRILAIWQAVNPNAWFPDPAPRGQSSSEPLIPFRTTPGNSSWWSSDDSRDIQVFGYNYPDLVGQSSSSQILQDFNRRYAWSVQSLVRIAGVPSTPPQDMLPIDISGAPVFQYPRFVAGSRFDIQGVDTSKFEVPAIQANKEDAQKFLGPDAEKHPSKGSSKSRATRQWYVDSEADRNAFDGTFTIYYFLGQVPENASQYPTAPNLAGVSHFFVSPPALCDNCMRQAEDGKKVYNTTAITPMLMDFVKIGQLQSLHPEHTKPFLIDNFRWRIVKQMTPLESDGATTPSIRRPIPVPRDQLHESLKIHINAGLMFIDPTSLDTEYEPAEDCDDVIEAILNDS